MCKMRAISLGETSLQLFRVLPEKQAGWLIRALARFAADGEEPESVPPSCLGSWLAVRSESERLIKTSRARSEAGKLGGAPKGNQNAKTNKNKQTQANAVLPDSIEKTGQNAKNGNGGGNGSGVLKTSKTSKNKQNKQKQADGDGDGDIFTDGTMEVNPKHCAGARALTGPSAHRPSVETSKEDSHRPSKGKCKLAVNRTAWEDDPYTVIDETPAELLPELATWACGEPGNTEAKRCYGGFAKVFGAQRLAQELQRFVAEIRSGESVRKPGAAFMKRIKAIWRAE